VRASGTVRNLQEWWAFSVDKHRWNVTGHLPPLSTDTCPLPKTTIANIRPCLGSGFRVIRAARIVCGTGLSNGRVSVCLSRRSTAAWARAADMDGQLSAPRIGYRSIAARARAAAACSVMLRAEVWRLSTDLRD